MKKSKIRLLYKICFIVLLILSLISIFSANNKYRYKTENDNLNGTVINVTYKDTYNVLLVKSESGQKYLSYVENDSTIRIGDFIDFKIVNKNIDNFRIPNTFNYRKYLKSKNIVSVNKAQKYKITDHNKVYKYRDLLVRRIQKFRSRDIVFAFIFADKSYFDYELKSNMNYNGIIHIICVSGFHIMFLFDLIKKIMYKFISSETIVILILFIISGLYLFFSLFSLPIFKAIIFYFLKYFNNKYNLNIKNIYILLITLFLTLICFPLEIYGSTLYFTFIISFYLCFYNKPNNVILYSLYIFIVTIPLLIYFNYSINMLSIILSLILSIFVFYILYLSSFLIMIFTFLDNILYFFLSVFNYINKIGSNINMFRIAFPKTNMFFILFLYVILLLFIKFKNKFYIVLFVLTLLFVKYCYFLNNSSYIYFLDVDQGDSILYISKHKRNVTLIDTGGIENNHMLFNNMKTFFYSLGVSKIDTLILTHGDFDHIGEAINLVNNFKVKKVIFNCGEYNDLENELIKVLDKKNIKYYSCIKELNIDNNKLYFLQTKEYDNENDNSNVIYTEINGYKFMFMGDASVTTEKEILDNYNLSDIDVLKVGHHGSRTSSSNVFINEINPKYSIISVGKNNRYGHPNKEVLENLENSKIYRTDQDGSIMFKIKNNKLKIETCSP